MQSPDSTDTAQIRHLFSVHLQHVINLMYLDFFMLASEKSLLGRRKAKGIKLLKFMFYSQSLSKTFHSSLPDFKCFQAKGFFQEAVLNALCTGIGKYKHGRKLGKDGKRRGSGYKPLLWERIKRKVNPKAESGHIGLLRLKLHSPVSSCSPSC